MLRFFSINPKIQHSLCGIKIRPPAFFFEYAKLHQSMLRGCQKEIENVWHNLSEEKDATIINFLKSDIFQNIMWSHQVILKMRIFFTRNFFLRSKKTERWGLSRGQRLSKYLVTHLFSPESWAKEHTWGNRIRCFPPCPWHKSFKTIPNKFFCPP